MKVYSDFQISFAWSVSELSFMFNLRYSECVHLRTFLPMPNLWRGVFNIRKQLSCSLPKTLWIGVTNWLTVWKVDHGKAVTAEFTTNFSRSPKKYKSMKVKWWLQKTIFICLTPGFRRYSFSFLYGWVKDQPQHKESVPQNSCLWHCPYLQQTATICRPGGSNSFLRCGLHTNHFDVKWAGPKKLSFPSVQVLWFLKKKIFGFDSFFIIFVL